MNKREIVTAIVLIAFSLTGHYYLSWHCAVSDHTRYLLKFVWIMVMVVTGYIGLLDYEIQWVRALWVIIYLVLIVAFGIDKLLELYYHKNGLFRIPSYQFTSPIPFLAVVYFPRFAKKQLGSIKRLSKKSS